LLVSFLAFQAAFLVRPAISAQSSEMTCCRTKRSCCCKKSGKIGPQWNVQPACAKQCLQSALVVSKHSSGVAASTAAMRYTPAAARLELQPLTLRLADSYLAFLYQRPPPSF
ncbi:MAG: hypothetical protein ACRD7E_16915, partial [Bryobacteraceae bacterium]